MKKFIVFGVVSLLIGSEVNAVLFSKVGTTGAKFLRIPAEPRGTGMAGACIAIVEDENSLYWNPAGMAFVETPKFVGAYMDWIADIYNGFFGFVIPHGLIGTFGVSIISLGMKKMEVTTVERPEGTGIKFGAGSIAAGLSYARRMTDKFAVGATIKYIQERIWDIASNGIAVDLGTWLIISHRIRGAFVITNFGPDMYFTGGRLVVDVPQPANWPEGWVGPTPMELEAAPYPLPLAFNMGVAYDVIKTPNYQLTLGGVMYHPNDGCEKLKIGSEIGLMKMLFIRAGYTHDEDDREDNPYYNVNFGVGVKAKLVEKEIVINYASHHLGRLGRGNQLSMNFGF